MGARDGPPALPATRCPILGRHTTSTSTGESDASTHARRCCPARTLTRSGRPIFVSRLQLRHARTLHTLLQQYHPPSRHPLLVKGPPQRPPTTSSASWTTPDKSSSSSLLLDTIRLGRTGAERDSWCLQTRQGRTIQQELLRNVDESHGVELADPAATS